MISNPISYHRQYRHDLVAPSSQKINRIQSVLIAALPILSFSPLSRTPLSIGLGTLRSATYLKGFLEDLKQNDFSSIPIKSIQLLLSLSALSMVVTALVNPYFNPSTALLLCGADDIIGNFLELANALKENDMKQLIESISHLASTVIYCSFLSFGHIEILATYMLLQIGFNLHRSIDEFRNDHYIEGTCHLITSALNLSQVMTQAKVISWKWRSDHTLEGQLCRDKRGFVYLKVKDEIVFELNETFGDSDLPPYFGKGSHGAHVTVMKANELGKNIPISELNKTIKFNIAYSDSLKPGGFDGVRKVSFLALCSPELDALRSKYGLTPKIHGSHDFHMTFGVKYET